MNTLTIDIYVSENNPTLIMLSANTIPRPETCLNAISDSCYFRYRQDMRLGITIGGA